MSHSLPSAPPPGKLLGLDVGLARIGVAVSDPLGLTVRPLTVVVRRSRNEDFAVLARLMQEEEAQAVICGLPLTMQGTEGDQARFTRKWAMRLAHALRVLLGEPSPIIFWDERLSTFTANELLAASGSNTAEDAVAAAVILQSYLDAHREAARDAVADRGPDLGRIDLPPRTA